MSLLNGIGLSLVYGALGVILLLIGYVVIDKALKKIDFNEELLKNNIAVGIVVGSFIIAIAIIVSAAIA